MSIQLALPCAVILAGELEAAARELGLSRGDALALACHHVAFRDGEILDELAFSERYSGDKFAEFTGPERFPTRFKSRTLELERDPRGFLPPPIAPLEEAAANIVELGSYLERLVELNAPEILLRHQRRLIQSALLAKGREWQPLDELMSGRPPSAGAGGEPRAVFVPFGARDPQEVMDVAFAGDEHFLVQFAYVSLLLDRKGAIVDHFPTRGLRLVDAGERYLLLTAGGGPTSWTGYFGARAFVRDVEARRFLDGEVPRTLTRFISGAAGDVKWSIVVDVDHARGFRTSPLWSGDQCGGTFNSTCNRYAFDSAHFVVDVAAATPVLDVRGLTGELMGFAEGTDGFRFIVRNEEELELDDSGEFDGELILRCFLQNARGETVRDLSELRADAIAIDRSAAHLLYASDDALFQAGIIDDGRALFDFSAFKDALAWPDDGDLSMRLAPTFGTARAFADASDDAVRAALEGSYGPVPDDEELAALRDAARAIPPLVTAR